MPALYPTHKKKNYKKNKKKYIKIKDKEQVPF
jgi:hypothetical protein